jgi:hypothetical protein
MRNMIMESQRDVVFTPLMLRCREAAAGVDVRVPLRLKSSSLRQVGHANDDWVCQRARAEQVIAEANAMLTGHTETIGLDDRIGAARLAFTVSRLDRAATITLRFVDRQAWLELERSYAPDTAPVELVELQVLEDLVVELIFDGGDSE